MIIKFDRVAAAAVLGWVGWTYFLRKGSRFCDFGMDSWRGERDTDSASNVGQSKLFFTMKLQSQK